MHLLGSSPRVWGQASNAGASSVKIRIIPTRMGTRRLRESVLNCKPDHPHAYGDKLYQLPFNVFGKGSSPRVWGQVRLHKVSCFLLWIIPTRMGTSITVKTPAVKPSDHPHAYGDKQVQNYEKNGVKGSSPRVWGQEFSMQFQQKRKRIIPTRMGTSDGAATGNKSKEDHPHAYGDKLFALKSSILPMGSSPRVWGQVSAAFCVAVNHGIIPTRMGTSRLSPFGAEGSEDHPHAYGDKLILILTHRKRLGSSPRVWGQGGCNGHKCYSSGIIPTRMGTSLGKVGCFTCGTDHPHAYGDKPVSR